MTDANGNVTDRFEYDSYANSLSHTGTSDTPFQYNGRFGVQTDSNGLLYMRARYYNLAIRRFVNQDVLFGDLNPGISLNRFAFANGNPISLMDPFGLCAEDDVASLQSFYASNTNFTNADVLPGMSFQNKFVTYGDEFYIDPGNFILTAGGGYTVYQASNRAGLQDMTFDALNLFSMISGVRAGVSVIEAGFDAIVSRLAAERATESSMTEWLNAAIRRGDGIWLVTDPAAHTALMNSIGRTSYYLDLELPMLEEYNANATFMWH
jgi:RHS repeat-associated protein